MHQFMNSQLCRGVTLLCLSMQLILVFSDGVQRTEDDVRRWCNQSLRLQLYDDRANPRISCEHLESADILQKVPNASRITEVVGSMKTNQTDLLKSSGSHSNQEKIDELNRDRDTFFTWNSIVLHVVVFFACFLLY